MRWFWYIVILASIAGSLFAEGIAGLTIDIEGPARDVGKLIVVVTSLLAMLIAFAVLEILDRIDKR